MAQALQNFREIWQRMSLLQRVGLLTVVLAVVGAGGVLVAWARQPHMVMLYSSLSPEEASKIVEKIRDDGTRYELKEGGTTIYVPEEKVYSLRLAMASLGLPAGDQGGYKILSEEKIGSSPFTQRINFIRAIEGELAKTVALIDGVASARVHVVKPESNVFAGKEKEASATAVLRLKSGWRMSGANVAAIVHLLAGSVEGLTPQRVVVVDSQGNLLSGEGNSELSTASSFLDYKSQVEQYLAHKAEDMLAAALGPGRASVKVEATIETTTMDTTTETYEKDSGPVLKETNKSTTPQPGPESRPSGGAKESNSETEYLPPPKTIKKQMDIPGKIASVSVAALVDLTPPPADPNNKNAAATMMDANQVTDIIRNATGVGQRTGDKISVVQAAFYHPAAQTPGQEQGQSNREFYLEIAKRGSLGVLVIGVLLALKIFRGSRKKAALAAGAAGSAAGALALQGQIGSAGMLPSGGETNLELLRARITRALQDNPEEVKRLFMNWIESGKGES